MQNKYVNSALTAEYYKHISAQNGIKKHLPLRQGVSEKYALFPAIYFSNNTTSVLINILQSIQSREERMLSIVYSDLEHPCIINAIEALWVGKKRKLLLHAYMLEGRLDNIEKELSTASVDKNSVLIISHVIWNSGIVLRIENIIKKLKKNNPSVTIIVDGAQAIGNVDLSKFPRADLKLLDIYVGCLHKWAGLETIVGFASINNKWLIKNSPIAKSIFATDRFSEFAGEVPGLNLNLISCSTIDLIFLKKVVKEFYSEKIKISKSFKLPLLKSSSLNFLPIEMHNYSKFLGVYADKKELLKICKVNGIQTDCISSDSNMRDNQAWLRIEKELVLKSVIHC